MDWILGTGFQNEEAKPNQFFLNFELCSVYISLFISTSTFCRHLTLPSFFNFLISLDITFLFQGPGFKDWILGTEIWGLDFGDFILGAGFWGPKFGDRSLGTGTGFLGLDFRIRKPRQTIRPTFAKQFSKDIVQRQLAHNNLASPPSPWNSFVG